MSKRGENIYHRKDGRWEARYIKGYKNGKAVYGYLYAHSYKEVKEKKQAVSVLPIYDKNLVKNKNITFEILSKLWLSNIMITVKESTYCRYVRIADKYLIPILGDMKLDMINSDIINRIPEKLLKEGGIRKKTLSPKTVSDILCVLKAIVKYGKENNYPVPDTKGIKYPQKSTKQINILSKENRINLKRKIINSEDNVSLGILFTLFTGIRIGELCGLKWEDIDLSSGVVTIKRTIERIADLNQNSSKKTKVIISNPKTGSSLRTIPLPDFLCSYLLTFKRNDNFYFLTASEKYIEPAQFYVKYKKFMSNLGMGQFTFHSLRHTFATNCVELGFDIKSLSEILGHANITTTLAIYVHPTMKQKRKQMNLLTPISL